MTTDSLVLDGVAGGLSGGVDDLVGALEAPKQVSGLGATGPSGAAAIQAHLATHDPAEGSTPEAEVVEAPTHGVERDFTMGPATGPGIKAFLERKQAEADAKAAAEG